MGFNGGNIRTNGFVPLDTNGNVPVAVKAGGSGTATTIYTEQISVSTTTTTPTSHACNYVLLYADTANSGTIYIGDSTSGFPVIAGNTVSIDISDSGNLNLISDSGTNTLYVLVGGI